MDTRHRDRFMVTRFEQSFEALMVMMPKGSKVDVIRHHAKSPKRPLQNQWIQLPAERHVIE